MINARWSRTLLGGTLSLLVIGAMSAPAAAQDQDDTSSVQQLADKYAPIVMIKAQDHPCDADGEPFEPTSVEILLDNPQIVLRQVGNGDPVIGPAPGAADIFGLHEGFYLDSPGNALEPGCIYEQDFATYAEGQVPTSYAHVATQDDRPGMLALQYWFYWYYNDWNNKHEGDWEGIQLLFDVGTVEEALAAEPVSVGYAQHEGGERADWDSSKLDRDGTHPIVFASAGSHASYFGSALYIGRSASEGFGCDNTDGPSRRLDTTAVVLPDQVDDPSDPVAWLTFAGRWGERHSGPFNGPTGPPDKDRWSAPIDWHDDLRASSVIVPGGDGPADEVIASFCGIVEWGSGQFIVLSTSPLRFAVTVAVVVAIGLWLVRRTDWGRVPSSPLVIRRRVGQILRVTPRVFGRDARSFSLFGLLYLPLSLVVAGLLALLGLVPFVGDALDATTDVAGAMSVVALFVGGVAGAILFTIIAALVAARLRPDDPSAGGTAVREVWARRRDLFGALGLAVAIVVGLALTIVGLPWAIRQYVRYLFLPQAVMIDRRRGHAALDRSSELVRGRWWHTATFALVLHVAMALVGLAVGLVVLLIARSLPMWGFSGLITLVWALLVPLAAIAFTMLYGDAVAELEGPDASEEEGARIEQPA